MMLTQLLKLAALVLALTAPVQAQNTKFEYAGRTLRFDESALNLTFNGLSSRASKYVVYFDWNGAAFLWFPGQRQVHATRWATDSATIIAKTSTTTTARIRPKGLVCFENFPTKGELCRSAENLKASVQEVAKGDIANLQSLKTPCRLCRADVTFEKLRKTTGGS